MREEQLQDFREKIESIRTLIEAKAAKGVMISNQNHFSWLTGGRGFIGLAATAACGSIIVTLDQVYLVAENIEATRLYKEQLQENPMIIVKEYPWHIPAQRAQIIKEICPEGLLDEGALANELFELRTALSAYDQDRYRDICQTTAKVLEGICKELKAGTTEYELAGILSKEMWANNLEPITLLIAFDERALMYRHPVPTDNVLKNYALIAVCTRRQGLIASATRMVALKHPGEEMLRRQQVAAYVNATLIAHTKEGADMADIFEKCAMAYKEKGFEGEWTFHHQGGLTGYNPREIKGMSDVHHRVKVGEAYGWNPSCQGAKSENTILVTKQGSENLTHTGEYKYIEVMIDGKTYLEEDILILNH